jgi:cysteine-rich repeat protein
MPGLLLLAVMLLTPRPTLAAYDMSGKWLAAIDDGTGVLRLDLSQSSGMLSEPPSPGPGWTGTIDEGTGVFHLESATVVVPMCGAWTVDGSVAEDGRTFTATYVRKIFYDGTPHCVTETLATTGTRCGNQQLDAWESCDDGNLANGDCCSSTCNFDAGGAACASDDFDCTNDACDGMGSCVHENRPGACIDLHGCGTGQCAGSACVIDAPEAAGTSCDRDGTLCTADACDGAGSCTAGPGCSPCETCVDAEGCSAMDLDSCNTDARRLSLSLTLDETGIRSRMKLKYVMPDYSGYAGLPTDSTMDAICVFTNDGGSVRPVYEATIPPAGTCGASDCWTVHGAGGFLYKDKTRARDGIGTMSIDPTGFKAGGGGPDLDFSLALPTSSSLVAAVVATDGDFFRQCWSHPLTIDAQSSTKLRASFKP